MKSLHFVPGLATAGAARVDDRIEVLNSRRIGVRLALLFLAALLLWPEGGRAQATTVSGRVTPVFDGSLGPRRLAKPLRLYAEITGQVLSEARWEWLIQALENSVAEYGFDEVNIHGSRHPEFNTYANYARVRRNLDAAALSRYRAQLLRFKRKGLKVTISDGQPTYPPDLFDKYPGRAPILKASAVRNFVADVRSAIGASLRVSGKL